MMLNKLVNSQQLTVCLYVDDLLCTCSSPDTLQWLYDEMCSLYGKVTQNDKVLSYLGQTFNFSSPGKCKVTMEGKINDLLKLESTTGNAATPALEDLFEVDTLSLALDATSFPLRCRQTTIPIAQSQT
jgi:hypothetical protein